MSNESLSVKFSLRVAALREGEKKARNMTSAYNTRLVSATDVSVADPDISFGGHEAPRSSTEGARIDAPKAPGGCGEGAPPHCG